MADDAVHGAGDGSGGGRRTRASKVQNRKGWDDDSEEDEVRVIAVHSFCIDGMPLGANRLCPPEPPLALHPA